MPRSPHAVPGPSVIGRVMAVLDMFGPTRPLITVDEIAARLGLSSASAYRYASDLTQAGLLARTSGRYRLGPKVIELEYLIRSYDPIISAGQDLMRELSESTGCDVLLCNVYDDTIVNVFHVTGRQPIHLTYTKGLPMPLFRGSQAHIILAHMDRRRLKRLFEAALREPASAADAQAIGADWTAFAKALRLIRNQGYYISRGELDEGVMGIAAPVFGEDQEIVGSLVLSAAIERPPAPDEAALIGLVAQAAQDLSSRIQAEAGLSRVPPRLR